jgi:type II secretion system protein D
MPKTRVLSGSLFSRSSMIPAACIATMLFGGVTLATTLQNPPETAPATPSAAPQDAPPARPAATPAPESQATPPATTPPTAPATATAPTPPVTEVVPSKPNADGSKQTTPPSKFRRDVPGMVRLSFKDQKISEFVPYIQEWTGKAVIISSSAAASASATVVSDREYTKHEALDLVFTAFRINKINVTEMPDVIILSSAADATTLPSNVIGAEQDVLGLGEEGVFVTKVFKIKHSKATDIYDRLQESLPPDGARLTADANANVLILESDIGFAKKVQLLINHLDVPPSTPVRTETFKIRYQDAGLVRDMIYDLFEGSGSSGGGRTTNRNAQQQQNQRGRQGQPGGAPQTGGGIIGTSEQLVVTVLPALNQITVRAEPPIVEEIRHLLETAWDLPPNKNGSPIRTYDLQYADPIKMVDTLSLLLESGGGQTRAGSNRAAAGGRTPFQGGGGEGGADVSVSNIFRFEPVPDTKKLVVISKTPENFAWLDEIIKQLDTELDLGLPRNVPLKYASAFEVADILNVLLAETGVSGGSIERPSEELTGIDFAQAGGGTGGTTGTEGATDTQGGGTGGTLPWQNAGRGNTNATQSEPSAIVGKTRIVPNAQQNSLLVLAPPQIESSVLRIIEDLDRPGRQVMITAIIAEVTLGDGFSWGLRVGNNLVPLNGSENSVGGEVSLDLTKGNGDGTGGSNFASPWFDVSLLTVGTDVQFLLQALKSTNNVRILQEPRVFTSDNAEAKFFAGQDVSFQTGQTTGGNTGGGTTSSFEDRPVGIGLNVRPRITKDRNVFMNIEILLSNLNLAVPQFNNNPVVERRQTNTRVTVRNGQTVVISGIRREDETSIKRAIPFLGEIPIGDIFFSSTEKKKNIAELVMFVTPVVVENPEENDTNYNAEERNRLRMLKEPLDDIGEKVQDKAFFEGLRTPGFDTRPEPVPAPSGSAPGPVVPVTNPQTPPSQQ